MVKTRFVGWVGATISRCLAGAHVRVITTEPRAVHSWDGKGRVVDKSVHRGRGYVYYTEQGFAK